MALERLPDNSPITDRYFLSVPWVQWLTKAWLLISTINDSGAARPTTNLFVGRQFFDTALGYPVYIVSVSGGIASWVDGQGNSV